MNDTERRRLVHEIVARVIEAETASFLSDTLVIPDLGHVVSAHVEDGVLHVTKILPACIEHVTIGFTI